MRCGWAGSSTSTSALAGGDAGTNNTGGAHAFVQNVLPTGVGLAAGVGTGTLQGIGSPSFRVFGAFTYTAVDRDPDDDGLLGVADTCPTEAEDRDGFEDADGCPDTDNDTDGIVDDSDLCPDAAEDLDGFDDQDGCSEPDNDFDTVLDAADRCPTTRGSVAASGCPDRDEDGVVDSTDECVDVPGEAAFVGCPDRDHDRVPEPRDKCPDDPIPATTDPATSDGCPVKVVAAAPAPNTTVFKKGAEIKIADRIEFELGKADLRVTSLPVLDTVVDLLKGNTGVQKVEVQGHTDNVGGDSANLTLSQKRAESVVAYLASKGVARDRLTAKGYGETVPLFSNKTASGRDQNRRVQFVILESTITDTQVGGAAPKPAPAVPKMATPRRPRCRSSSPSRLRSRFPSGGGPGPGSGGAGPCSGGRQTRAGAGARRRVGSAGDPEPDHAVWRMGHRPSRRGAAVQGRAVPGPVPSVRPAHDPRPEFALEARLVDHVRRRGGKAHHAGGPGAGNGARTCARSGASASAEGRPLEPVGGVGGRRPLGHRRRPRPKRRLPRRSRTTRSRPAGARSAEPARVSARRHRCAAFGVADQVQQPRAVAHGSSSRCGRGWGVEREPQPARPPVDPPGPARDGRAEPVGEPPKRGDPPVPETGQDPHLHRVVVVGGRDPAVRDRDDPWKEAEELRVGADRVHEGGERAASDLAERAVEAPQCRRGT